MLARGFRQTVRHASTIRSPLSQARPPIRWSTGKALLLSTLTGVSTYAIGLLTSRAADQAEETASIISKFQPAPKYGGAKELLKAMPEIQAFMGEDGITTDDEELERHGFSSWATYNIETRPIAVAFPKTTEDVSKIAKICHKYRLPMIAYSGGTSLEGHFSATQGGICLDFAHMDQILTLHKDDLDVVVQPAIGWQELNQALKDHNLFFPPDPGPGARIGGMIGTGCSGTNAARYGTMKEWVLSLTVVLADGTIVKTRRRPRKSSAGYDLTRLFVGSEGTLGLVTEATLKLAVVPEVTRVAIAPFPTLFDAASCVSQIMAKGIPCGALELLDEVQMKAVNQSTAGSDSRVYKELPYLFMKFSGSQASVDDQVQQVNKIAKATNAEAFEFARNEADSQSLWLARKEALWSLMAAADPEKGEVVWTTDYCVPLSNLPQLIKEVKEKMTSIGVFASIVSHAGDGNAHSIILYNKADPVEKKAVEDAVSHLVKRSIELDGTCTGEHGVGIVKKKYLLQELGEETVGLMKRLKLAVDPLLLLNPNKIFDFTEAENWTEAQ